MNKYIEQLLQGREVEWKPLGEVAEYEQPTKYLVKSTSYRDSYPTPVLTAGKTLLLGYTNEEEGVYNASENPVIIFDDFTTANKWIDYDFKVKSSAIKMITSIDEELCLLRFIYYWLNTLPNIGNYKDHKRQWISNFSNLLIPVPPPDVQRKIVRILDNFTLLTAELTAELQAREKQYEYYREILFENIKLKIYNAPTYGSIKTLGEVVKMKRGKRVIKKELSIEGFPVYQNSLTPLGYFEQSNCSPKSVFIISAGAAGDIGFSEAPFWAADDCWYFEDLAQVSQRYLYFGLKSQEYTIYSNVRKASIPRLSRNIIEQIKIPIPPIGEQELIVGILDKFDALVNSISEGLPKEIELRKKQYEYYREQLLTFK